MRNIIVFAFFLLAVFAPWAFADGSGSAAGVLPDPSADPGGVASLLSSLYQHGALIPLGILVAFFGLEYASTHIAWLQVGKRTAYVAAVLGGLAVLAAPAAQGTTPNAQMLVSALTTMVALVVMPKAVAK